MGALDELLLTLRSRAGLSQETLAERSGVSARTISDIERGLARARGRSPCRCWNKRWG